MDEEDTLPPHGQHHDRRAASEPEMERRRVVDQQFAAIVKRLDEGDTTMRMQAQATLGLQRQVGEIQGALTVNTAMTKENNEVVIEVRDILTTFKALIKFAGWTGKFAKWAGGIAVAVGSAYATWKGFFK